MARKKKTQRVEFHSTEQVKELLEQTKTLQGFWGGAKGNASTSEVINYILCDYLLDSSNIQSCRCGAWLKFESQLAAGEKSTEIIKCPSCGKKNITEL